MIPSLSSSLLPGNTVLPASPAMPEMANMPLPLVPTFMLGSISSVPQPAPPLTEEAPLTENSDPEQLMQLLLDPTLTLTPAIAPPQTPGSLQATPHLDMSPVQTVQQRDMPQRQTAPAPQVSATLIKPQVPVAPQVNAPQMQITPQVNTPQVQMAPQINAPQLETALSQPVSAAVIAPQMPGARLRDTSSMQSALQHDAPQIVATTPVPVLPQPVIAPPLTAPHIQPMPHAPLQTIDRSTVMPQNIQPQTLAGQVMTHGENVPLQPLKLRTPKDAREASKQILALMQAQPNEPLTKVLPPQMSTQAQQLLHINHPATQPSAPAQPALRLPEGAQEKAAVLREALGERLQMQIDERSQKATIRLDPPNLGKLDISLHYEGGKLQVQIQAAQPEVYRALQQVSQELRGTLIEQNQVAVNLQISQQQGEQRHAPRQQHTQDAVLSNSTLNEVTEEQRHHDLSILTTV